MAHELLADVSSDQIAVYIVWVPIWEGEMEPKAVKAAAEIHDPRIQQFWTDDIAVPQAFSAALKWGNGDADHASGPVPWDLHALYPAGVKWERQPPTPTDWVSPVVRDKELAAKIRSLVPKS